ncbi:hypothetical protein [Anaeromyxobacter paludicola]|nr:hypothetical protein [Anaeromyxobacter paludicola]
MAQDLWRAAIEEIRGLRRDVQEITAVLKDAAARPAETAEWNAGPLARQGRSFALDANRRRKVEAGLALDLPAVLRADAPAFDLETMLSRFDQLWRR